MICLVPGAVGVSELLLSSLSFGCTTAPLWLACCGSSILKRTLRTEGSVSGAGAGSLSSLSMADSLIASLDSLFSAPSLAVLGASSLRFSFGGSPFSLIGGVGGEGQQQICFLLDEKDLVLSSVVHSSLSYGMPNSLAACQHSSSHWELYPSTYLYSCCLYSSNVCLSSVVHFSRSKGIPSSSPSCRSSTSAFAAVG